MKRLLSFAALAVSLFFIAAIVEAASAVGRYRIELSDGTRIETLGYPVAHGSVWTFHSADGGPLTGVPREMVARIVPADEGSEPAADAIVRAEAAPSFESDLEQAPAPLEPGELVVLPSTGDGPAAVPAAPAVAGVGAPGAVPVYAYGYGGLPNPYYGTSIYGAGAALPPGAIGPDGMPRVLSSTDLSQALSATVPAGAIGSNGFPTLAPTTPTVIGPDGTPTLGAGASMQFAIGSDGYPVLAGQGQPGSSAPVIGSNGTPVLAPAAQPGATSPTIGSNGTPILAPAGQAGSAFPTIGPNGTPILAPPGQPGSTFPTIGSNGTPVAPAPVVAPRSAGKH